MRYPMRMEIRVAAVQGASSLHSAATRTTYTFERRAASISPDPARRGRTTAGALLADPQVHFRVAEIGGAVAGYVVTHEVRQPAHVF